MDELIDLISQSEMISIPEMCEKLHLSKDMLLARLERYEQLGYIKKVIEKGAAGSSACSCNCNSCKGCHTSAGSQTPGVYWVKV